MQLPNYWYFSILFILGLIIFVVTMLKGKDKKRLIQTFAFISGMSYLFDLVVLVIFNAYQYKPQVINSLWFDSGLGSIISQGFIIPVVAMVIVGFNLGFLKIVWISVAFMGIEELFLAVDVYEQHWWKTWYTGILLIIGFHLAKLWYHLLQHPTKFIKMIMMYASLSVFVSTIRYFMVLIWETHYYTIGLFSNVVRDHIAGNSIFIFLWMIPITMVVIFFFKWYFVLSLLISEYIMDNTFISFGILHLSPKWHVSYFVFLLLATVIMLRILYIRWFLEEG